MGAARQGGGSFERGVGAFAPALLYGALAWRILALRRGMLGALGIVFALLAYRGHVSIWRWARGRREGNVDRPPPLGWIAVTVAAVIAIVVLLGRGR